MLSDLEQFDHAFFSDGSSITAGQQITRGELWMNIIRVLPWARGKTLRDDFTEFFRTAMESESLEYMHAVLDLLRLRFHYWSYMQNAGWNFYHINQIELETMRCFYSRISDRLDQTEVGKISNNVVVPSVFPKKVRHAWQH